MFAPVILGGPRNIDTFAAMNRYRISSVWQITGEHVAAQRPDDQGERAMG